MGSPNFYQSMPTATSGTYTPTITRTGAVISGVVLAYYFRVGNMVWVQGYADMAAGGGTNDIIVSLPITPTAFTSVVTNEARSECSGTCTLDNGTTYGVIGTYSSTTASIENVPNGASGLRFRFCYRVS